MSTADDQALRLRAVLGDLMENRVSIADAAAQVRTMHFPEPPEKTVGQRMADGYENEVPENEQPGSFRMVSRAYSAGRINLRQYEALADAAADAISGRSPGHDDPDKAAREDAVPGREPAGDATGDPAPSR